MSAKIKRRTWIVIISAVLIVAAGITYLVVNTDPNAVAAVNDGYDQYRDSLENAKAAFDNGSAIFVDVRSTAEYAESHIEGAITVPLADIAGNEPNVDKGALIYTYCTWTNEASSARAAEYLQSAGYTNVYAIVGGYRAWIEAGYPIVTGN